MVCPHFVVQLFSLIQPKLRRAAVWLHSCLQPIRQRLNARPRSTLCWREPPFARFLAALPLAILVHNRHGQLVYLNPAARALFRLKGQPAIRLEQLPEALSIYQAGSDRLYPTAAWPTQRSRCSISTWADDLELRTERGTIGLHLTSTPLLARRRVIYIVSSFRPTGRLPQTIERLQTEIAALRSAQAIQATLLGAIPDLLLRFSSRGVFLGLIHAGDVPQIVPVEEQVGKHLSEFLPSPMAEQRLQAIEQAITTQAMQIREYTFVHQGQVRHEESRIVPSAADEVLVIVRDITERRQADLALAESQAFYQSLTEVLPQCLYRTDCEGRFTFVNTAFVKMVNRTQEQCVGKTVFDLYPDDLAEIYSASIQQVIETGQGLQTVEARPRQHGSDAVYVQVVKSPIYGLSGEIIGVQGISWDITDLKQTQEQLTRQKQFLQQVIDNVPSAVLVKNCQGQLIAVNRASTALYGLPPEAMLGQTEAALNTSLSAAELEQAQQLHQQVMTQRAAVQAEQLMVDSAGNHRWYQIIISPFVSVADEVQGTVSNFIDITERKAIEAALQAANLKLERLATLDSLTKVANRRRFDEYLRQEWQRMSREEQPLSLVLLDVDYFKRYNDHLGHQQGDQCLIAVAAAICQAVKRSIDLVARYGGEEFAIILPNTRRIGAMVVAETVQSEIASRQLSHPSSPIGPYLTVSMGIASTLPSGDVSCSDLVAAADAALYQAKRRGRNGYWVRVL